MSERVEVLDLGALGESEVEMRAVIRRLASMATGRLAIQREMTTLDDRLGLNPKALAALRWTIVAEPQVDAASNVVSPDRWRNIAG